MQYPYWTWPGCISVDDCDLILNHCKNLEVKKGLVGEDKNDLQSRNSNIAWVHDLEIKRRLHSIGNSINISAFGFDLYADPSVNDVQFTEYSSLEKQKYDYHLDTIFNDGKYSFLDRKLSLVLQLSDPSEYEGGDLVFKYSSKVFLLRDKFCIDLKICSYLIPLFSRGFFKLLTFVLKYFSFLLDGSLKYVPKIFLEILIKNFFFISNKGLNKLTRLLILLSDFIADRPFNPLPLESLIKKVST